MRTPASRASQDSYIEYMPTESHPMRASQDTMRTSADYGATFPFPHAITPSEGTIATSVETPPHIGAGGWWGRGVESWIAGSGVFDSKGGCLQGAVLQMWLCYASLILCVFCVRMPCVCMPML